VAGASGAESGLQALTDALVPDFADVAAVYVTADLPRLPYASPMPPQVITVAARCGGSERRRCRRRASDRHADLASAPTRWFERPPAARRRPGATASPGCELPEEV